MTERKPPGVSWESWFEQQIREAQAAGAFDNLAGAGKPLPDLDKPYDPDWWVKQLVRREQVSVLPPALDAEIAKVNRTAAEGPSTRLAPFDVDAIVDEWTARRA